MKSSLKIMILVICLFLISCKQSSKNVAFFEKTEAYDLAKAVEKEDLEKIEKLIQKNPNLLKVTNDITGSNVLSLALTLENFESFKKLLELGADPNFINLLTKRSVLIDACTFYDKPEAYTIDLRYIKLLLKEGANPNYAVESDFTDHDGNYHTATTALNEASELDLNMVKVLIKAGADPYKKIGQNEKTPFCSALGGFKNKFTIVDYYIDSLKVNVKAPLSTVTRQPSNKIVELFIQDYIRMFFSYEKGTSGYLKTQKLIHKLENKGVEFENYNYK